jgi:N-acetylglucosamine malate deacetylase 1
MKQKVAIAVAAHPDDIEFLMAGTLVLLRQAGYETHYLNLASGNCGSTRHSAARARSVRATEARSASKILGAQFHPSLTDDLEILYGVDLLRRLASIIRQVKPSVLLTHSPQDYMEDHTNTCRLAVTAAFARGMPNFKTVPPKAALDSAVTVYHAMPAGLRDPLRRRIIPGAFVNTARVHRTKREALAAHKSQQSWLDESQGMNCYLLTMEDMAREVGKLSKRFQLAEGWRRHLHLGFCGETADPLKEALGRNYLVNALYEKQLDWIGSPI